MGYESPYRKNILYTRSLNIEGTNDRGDRATWSVAYEGDRVVITVFTNIKDAPRKGVMSLRLGIDNWYRFLSMMEKTLENRETAQHVLMISGPKAGGSYKDPYVLYGKLFCDRDSDGQIYVALYQENAPKPIKFILTDSPGAKFVDRKGEPLDKVVVSEMITKGYINQGRDIISSLCATDYVAPEDTKKPSGGGYKSKSQNYGPKDSSGPTDDDELF